MTYPFESYFDRNYLSQGEKIIILDISSIIDKLKQIGLEKYCTYNVTPVNWVYILLDCAVTFDFDIPEEVIVSIEKITGQSFSDEFNLAVFDNYMTCAYEELLKLYALLKNQQSVGHNGTFHRVFGLADDQSLILTYF